MSTPNVGYGTLSVIPSLRGFEASLRQSTSTQLASAGRDAGQRYGRSFGDGAQPGLLSTQTKLAGLAAGGALAYKAIGQASSLAESLSKSQVVFGGLSGEVERFGSGAAKSLGLSKQQAIEAASTFGNLFTAMKIGQGPAEQMSLGLVKLSSDLASFNNTRPEDALNALRSGLVGETEPLRTYGVNLTDATLKAKAMELGLYSGKGALDAASRAQAAYALILEQTKTAQGDYARTADGLANKQRTASAQFKDSQAILGSALIPAMKAATTVGGTLASVFGSQSQGAVTLEVGILALTAAYSKLGPPIRSSIASMRTATVADEAQTVAAGEAAAANTGLGLSFGSVATAALAGIVAFEGTTKALNALTNAQTRSVSGDGLASSLDLLVAKGKAGGEVAEKYGADLRGLAKDFKLLDSSGLNKFFSLKLPQSARKEIDQFDKSIAALVTGGNLDEARAKLQALHVAMRAQGVIDEDVDKRLDDTDKAFESMALKAEAAAAGVDSATGSLQAWHQANKDLILSTSEQIGKSLDLRSATRDLTASAKAYAENEETAAGRGAAIAAVRAQAAQTATQDALAYKAAVQQLAEAHRTEEAAERGVTSAIRSREEAVRGVAEAERGVREAELGRQTAIRNLAVAQQDLTRFEQNSVDLAADLATAYDDARDSLQGLQDAAAGDKISVGRAQIALDRAQQAALDGPTSDDPNAAKELTLDLAAAQLAYKEAQDRAAQSASDLQATTAAGLDQSPQVLAAQQAIVDNNVAIVHGHLAVDEASHGVETADHAVATAHLGVGTAQQAVVDANQAVIDAGIRVQDSHKATADAAAAVGAAALKSKDDQVIAQFEIALLQKDAAKKSGELRDAMISDFDKEATAVQAVVDNLAGTSAWLHNIATTSGPEAYAVLKPLADLYNGTPQPVGTTSPLGVPGTVTGGVGAGGSGSGSVDNRYNATGGIAHGPHPRSRGQKANVTIYTTSTDPREIQRHIDRAAE